MRLILPLVLALAACADTAPHATAEDSAALGARAGQLRSAHHVMGQYQPAVVTGVAATGYSILNATPASVVAASCRSGEYWIRLVRTATVAATGANAALTNPASPPITSGWLHVLPGDNAGDGSDRTSNDTPIDQVNQIDVWVVTPGELVIHQH